MSRLGAIGGWLATPMCAVVVAAAVAAVPAAPIQLNAAQLKAAGITTDTVTAAAVASAAAGVGITLHGRVVVPNERIEVVLSNLAGQLESVSVSIGESVRAGQALGRIYSAELLGLQRDYLLARAQAQLQGERLKRDESLLADGIVSAGRLQETRAAAMAADASLQQTRQLLRLAGMSNSAIEALKSAESITPHLTLVARAAGVLLDQSAVVGQRLEPGDAVFRLASGRQLNLELQASPLEARRLQPGDVVTAANCTARGRITAVGAQLNAANQTVNVKARFDDGTGCFRPNEFVQVSAVPAAGAADLLSVASAAITRVGARDYVFVQGDGGFRPVQVSVVQQVGTHSWVRGELRGGEKVAQTGVAALKGTWQGLGAAAQATE